MKNEQVEAAGHKPAMKKHSQEGREKISYRGFVG
jgi:hypothetical protein